jgi:hypothetical protein
VREENNKQTDEKKFFFMRGTATGTVRTDTGTDIQKQYVV